MERIQERLTLIEYEDNGGKFRAMQIRNGQDATMGYRELGILYFFPEEAVWLAEVGSAVIITRGVPLSVQRCFSLLQSAFISPERYFVYSFLKRTGYVVLPAGTLVPFKMSAALAERYALATATLSTNDDDDDVEENADDAQPDRPAQSPDSTRSEPSESEWMVHYPASLLSQFPDYSRKVLKMYTLHKNPKIRNQFGLTQLSSSKFEQPISGRSLNPNPRVSGAKFFSRENLRPEYWPRFDDLASGANCWKDYRDARRQLILHATVRRIPSVPESGTSRTANASPVGLLVDYDIYVADETFSRSFTPEPKYRLLIVNGCNAPLPPVAHLIWLNSQFPNGKLLVATVRCGSVLFHDVTHSRVEL